MAGPVLVVQHQDTCPPALVGEWLAARGLGLDVRRPYAGDPLPGSAAGHAALLVLGGEMGACDDADAPWLPQTRGLIASAVGSSIPVLGICLGHQLACVALGGAVAPNPAGRTVGLQRIGLLPAAVGDPLLGGLPQGARAVHWNEDIATRLPDGATTLAITADGAPQAVRLAPSAWGVQFHPEVTPELITSWARHDAAAGESQVSVARAVADMTSAAPELSRVWRPVADAFADVVERTSASASRS